MRQRTPGPRSHGAHLDPTPQTAASQHFEAADATRRGFLKFPEFARFLQRLMPDLQESQRRAILSYLNAQVRSMCLEWRVHGELERGAQGTLIVWGQFLRKAWKGRGQAGG